MIDKSRDEHPTSDPDFDGFDDWWDQLNKDNDWPTWEKDAVRDEYYFLYPAERLKAKRPPKPKPPLYTRIADRLENETILSIIFVLLVLAIL